MLDQKRFSNLVKEFLKNSFPQFLNNIKTHPDDSFECSYRNPLGKFTIWIATYNLEITVGLESSDGNSDCHTHFTPYEPEDFEDVLERLSTILKEVFQNKLLYFYSSKRGYSWTSDVRETLLKRKSNESIEFFSWDGSLDRNI